MSQRGGTEQASQMEVVADGFTMHGSWSGLTSLAKCRHEKTATSDNDAQVAMAQSMDRDHRRFVIRFLTLCFFKCFTETRIARLAELNIHV